MKQKLKKVPEYPGLLIDPETLKIYREANGEHIELHFYRDVRGFFVRNITYLGLYVRRARVIALALVKRPEGAFRIRHKDGNISNDTPENLEWVTHKSSGDLLAKARERMREKAKGHIFITFADGKQHWVDKAVAEKLHLTDLKPKARGFWKPEFYTK